MSAGHFKGLPTCFRSNFHRKKALKKSSLNKDYLWIQTKVRHSKSWRFSLCFLNNKWKVKYSKGSRTLCMYKRAHSIFVCLLEISVFVDFLKNSKASFSPQIVVSMRRRKKREKSEKESFFVHFILFTWMLNFFLFLRCFDNFVFM